MRLVLISIFAMHSMVVTALPFSSGSLVFDENQDITTQNYSNILEREIDSTEIQTKDKTIEDLSVPDVAAKQKPSSHTIGFENDHFTAGLMLGFFTVLLLIFTVVMVAKMIEKLQADVLECRSFSNHSNSKIPKLAQNSL